MTALRELLQADPSRARTEESNAQHDDDEAAREEPEHGAGAGDTQ